MESSECVVFVKLTSFTTISSWPETLVIIILFPLCGFRGSVFGSEWSDRSGPLRAPPAIERGVREDWLGNVCIV